MKVIEGLKYSKEHEWVKVEGDTAYVGITDFAQHSLGEIVYVELPEEGAEFSAGDTLSAIDSVKAASDVYAPVSGSVVKVNDALSSDPGSINGDPYTNWIAVLKLDDASETDDLLNAKEYEEFCKSEE
jgi:glycine cleavage system H protein